MRVPLVLLTGVPRSGTALSCELINRLPDARALDEPMQVGALIDRATTGVQAALDTDLLCGEIAAFAECQRRSILDRGVALSRHVGGRVSGGRIADGRDENGVRRRVGERGEIRLERPSSEDFTLVLKHPVLFTAMLGVLRERFSVFAIVRNPLAVMGSWEGMPMMVRTGDLGLPAVVAPELSNRLAGIEDVTERQLCLLDWYFGMYEKLLPRERIVRYEEIVSSGGTALASIVPAAVTLRVALEGRNATAVYDREHMLEVGNLLLSRGQAPWRSFYPASAVEELLDRV
ncbi:MAG: hypothetical protein ACHQDY_00205 [Solirubrobacterales bacterium]